MPNCFFSENKIKLISSKIGVCVCDFNFFQNSVNVKVERYLKNQKHIVNLFRTGDGQFDVDDIDPTLCTHGFYGFAELNNVTWKVVPVDPW
jgi:hypothetical protein